jgi:putative phosphonate metabolism protein
MTSYRYAIFFAPHPRSALWRLASAWLGRDAATGEPLARPAVAGIPPSDMAAMTEEPARYGFHATLKPPFRLAKDATEQGFLDAAERFAATRAPVPLPRLAAATIGNFVALTPATGTSDLLDLAAACVETFDPFRAPPEQAELERRRRTRLTAREEALLQRWGYPYVMDAFRFHMTLTGPLAGRDIGQVCRALGARFEPVTARSLAIDAITVFDQPSSDAPFRILERFPFPAGA